MGFFKNILGYLGLGSKAKTTRTSASPASFSAHGEEKSLLKILLKMGAEIDAKPCSLDHNTSPVCPGTVVVYGTKDSTAEIFKDVGGYCPRCKVYRCGTHSVWLHMELAFFKKSGGRFGNEHIEVILAAMAHSSGKAYDSMWLLGCPVCKQNYAGEGGRLTGLHEIVGR